MITLRRSAERGHRRHGWLETFHTFSFADYHDPAHMGFHALRVINQDFVAPGKGFATHGHRDMEIVTCVLEGALEHRDSMGNGSRILPGEVQLMSAGTGVTHSEFNPSAHEPLHLLQMWVLPRARGSVPRYEQRAFPEAGRRGRLQLVVSPEGRNGSLTIGQDARLFVGSLDGRERIVHELCTERAAAWLHVARGSLVLNGEHLAAGDGAALEGAGSFTLEQGRSADFVLWELAAMLPSP